jgi:hypothetical protein
MRSTRTLIAFAIALFLVSDVFASSNPIPGVGIVVKRPPGSSTARTKTDKEGNFKFTKLEPGTYTLEVVSDDVTDAIEKMERKSSRTTSKAKKGDASDGLATGTVRSTVAETTVTSSPLIPEISITDGSAAARNGGALTSQWTQVDGPMTIIVGEDGTISGQLRASSSTR